MERYLPKRADLQGLVIYYAFGGRAPSSKKPNDLEFYELALDMRMDPILLRKMKKESPRDYNKLMLVNNGRKLGIRQIAAAHDLQTTQLLEL